MKAAVMSRGFGEHGQHGHNLKYMLAKLLLKLPNDLHDFMVKVVLTLLQ